MNPQTVRRRALRDVLGFLIQQECPHAPGPYAEPCEGMMRVGRYVRELLDDAGRSADECLDATTRGRSA